MSQLIRSPGPTGAPSDNVLREAVRVVAQAPIDTEVTALVGAERHELTDERTGYRYRRIYDNGIP